LRDFRFVRVGVLPLLPLRTAAVPDGVTGAVDGEGVGVGVEAGVVSGNWPPRTDEGNPPLKGREGFDWSADEWPMDNGGWEDWMASSVASVARVAKGAGV
jgi:hypothetical protein